MPLGILAGFYKKSGLSAEGCARNAAAQHPSSTKY
jgi:hypothetical protein